MHCFPFRKHYFDIEQPALHKEKVCAHTLLLEDFLGSLGHISQLQTLFARKDAAYMSVLKTDKAVHTVDTHCSSCLRRCTTAEQKPRKMQKNTAGQERKDSKSRHRCSGLGLWETLPW